jgi:hypothetical protein
MKVWVCRNAVSGLYLVFESWCTVYMTNSGVWTTTNLQNALLVNIDPHAFKRLTGLKEHLDYGTHREMKWNPVALRGK